MNSQQNLEKDLQQKFHEQFSKSVSVRPNDVHFIIDYNGYTFKFVKYLKKNKKFQYICKYGYNKHKKIESRCLATIKVPLSIIVKNSEKIPIEIDNPTHTCIKQTDNVELYIKDAEIKQKIEEIYFSKNPRPSRNELLIELLQKIQPPISKTMVNSHYTYLEKKYKKIDKDFSEFIKTTDGKRFELFKIRFFINNPPVSKFIICFCSDFQKSLINDSRIIHFY